MATILSNNLTSLYGGGSNTVITTTVVPNVAGTIPSRNLTTLYSGSGAPVTATTPYGNSNVESFLNAGTDGGNNVVNIVMSGDLTVGLEANFTDVSYVHIPGGQLNYILTTDGGGGLSWEPPPPSVGSFIPFIHFDVLSDGNNQQFADANLSFYSSNVQYVNLMKNGVNIDPTNFQFINSTTIQVDILLETGDSVDILATGAGGGAPGGNTYDVQINGSGTFYGDNGFQYQPGLGLGTVIAPEIQTQLINVTTLNVSGNGDIYNGNIYNLTAVASANLGDVSTITIGGGAANYVLTTDGAGILSWTTGGGPGGNVTWANILDKNGINGPTGISLGQFAGNTADGINIGIFAGNTNSGSRSVNIGESAAETNQLANSVAVGFRAGRNNQGFESVALGKSAGYQNLGNYSVALGAYAGYTNQANNSIILNATGSNLNQTTANTFTVKPVRSNITTELMFYDTSTGEISYNEANNAIVGNANYAAYAGNVVTSAQPNITSVGNLVYLNVRDDSNTSSVIRQFTPNSLTINIQTPPTVSFDTTNIYWPNANTGMPSRFVIRNRGNSTTPTTAVSGDRIINDRFVVFNGNTNVLAGAETWTLTAGGTLDSNANQVFAGGQWNLLTGNPAGGNLANANSVATQNQLIFTNSGSLQINPGAAPNTSLGMASSSLVITNYGLTTTDLVSSGGMNQQKARGNRDGLLSVQPGDTVGRVNFWGYNGSAYQSSRPTSIYGVVDSAYVANATIIPLNMVIRTVNSSNVSVDTTFYGNGLTNFPGNITTTGNVSAGYFIGNGSSLTSITGANVTGQVANSLVSGTVYTNAQPNITSTGTLTSLTVSGNLLTQGNVTLQRAFEIFTPNSTGSTGTVNFDVLTQSIINKTANATANFTINIRGNSSVTFDTMLPSNNSVTLAYLNTVGATGYIANVVTVDGVTVTPKYVYNSTPTTGTRLTNCTQSYTYTLLKTAANTYTVLGSFTEYQ